MLVRPKTWEGNFKMDLGRQPVMLVSADSPYQSSRYVGISRQSVLVYQLCCHQQTGRISLTVMLPSAVRTSLTVMLASADNPYQSTRYVGISRQAVPDYLLYWHPVLVSLFSVGQHDSCAIIKRITTIQNMSLFRKCLMSFLVPHPSN
jgi:hypothetical protein